MMNGQKMINSVMGITRKETENRTATIIKTLIYIEQ